MFGSHTPVSRLPKVRSDKITQSARGMPCALRLPGCLPGNETVVLAHLPGVGGKGMSTKVSDLAGVYACHSCHDLLDRRRSVDSVTQGYLLEAIPQALVETHARMVEAGIIVVPGAKLTS